MWFSWKHSVVALTTLTAVAVGGAIFAASPPPAATGGFWTQVAQRLDISSSQLTAAIQATQIANMEKVAASHHWSATQIQNATNRIQHEHLGVPTILHPLPGIKLRALLGMAAHDLHITPIQLTQALHQDQTLGAVATADHSSPAALQQALLTTLDARVQTAVSKGHLTTARAKVIDQHYQGLAAKWMTRDLQHVQWRQPLATVVMHRASKFLGISLSQLRQDFKQGQSIAQVAQAQGKPFSVLLAAMVAPNQTYLQKQVSTAHLTAAQAKARLSHLEALITQILNRVHSGTASQ